MSLEIRLNILLLKQFNQKRQKNKFDFFKFLFFLLEILFKFSLKYIVGDKAKWKVPYGYIKAKYLFYF